MTPLDEGSARRIHDRKTSMPPAGFETIILTNEKPQAYVLDHAATGSDFITFLFVQYQI